VHINSTDMHCYKIIYERLGSQSARHIKQTLDLLLVGPDDD
jgi:hypothetical protein